MKRTFAAAAAILFVCAAVFCKDVSQEPVDVYDDESQAEAVDTGKKSEKKVTKIKWNTKANREAAMEADPYNQKKMRGNRSFGERLLNINKFTKIDPYSVYLKPTVGKMFLRKGHLIYREGTDIGGFLVYYDSSAYALQFSKAARNVVRDSVERYLKDFDEKRLDRAAPARKTRMYYGFCDAYEDYGVISGMMTNFSKPRVYCGYIFDKKTPYFTLYVRSAKNLAVEEKSEEGSFKGTTIEQIYYLTKAQAQRLSVFLSDQNIGALQRNSTVEEFVGDADNYDAVEPAPAAVPATQPAPAAQTEQPAAAQANPAAPAPEQPKPADQAAPAQSEPAAADKPAETAPDQAAQPAEQPGQAEQPAAGADKPADQAASAQPEPAAEPAQE